MNDPIPKPVVEIQVQAERRLSSSEKYTTSVLLTINTKRDETLVNPSTATGHRTLKAIPLSYIPMNFSLLSCSHHHIQLLLQFRLHRNDHWLCNHLVPKISTAAINAGFGYKDVDLTVRVTVTYPYVFVDETSLKVLRVRLGRIKAEELKSLNMETESCSICLKSLVSRSKALTRMSCSHVFHNDCLVEWLYRKNTCPICRTVLYHVDD
ncbi:Zinc finger RING-type [Arabidopsis thaliana x Arabidopsis arenosa]|uniref:Zinc finger RING-type n=1 Tax=Arabidopsis thaliana x Arabidopsis arenosa TaxID=1240361 RepID=A0A8T1Z3N3_9BRAS|nr:Zinc finger RING-type [Arabidopsis thaliana x Arabidopsis arenosa]